MGLNSIRVFIKRLISRFICINSYCKKCGCKVEDFYAPNYLWSITSKELSCDCVLCFNCFSRIIKQHTDISYFVLYGR